MECVDENDDFCLVSAQSLEADQCNQKIGVMSAPTRSDFVVTSSHKIVHVQTTYYFLNNAGDWNRP
jgi:hypothetical protein